MGNSLTSQRVTDVVFRAFGACAASQGCMNSVQMYGGEKPKPGECFAGYTLMYGETIFGGSGAGPTWRGVSAVHTVCSMTLSSLSPPPWTFGSFSPNIFVKNMTNTRITDLEILEKRYPVRVKEFPIRPDSGGQGLHPGGNGAIRAFEARAAMTFSLSSERRVHQPYGMAGGGPGKSGRNLALLKLDDGRDRWVNVGGKGIIQLKCGEQLYVHTPGGGGWGSPREQNGVDAPLVDENDKPQPQYWRGTGNLHPYAAAQNEG